MLTKGFTYVFVCGKLTTVIGGMGYEYLPSNVLTKEQIEKLEADFI